MTIRRDVVIRGLQVVAVAFALMALGLPAAQAHHGPPYPSGPEHEWGEMVAYPMVFPVGGTNSFGDTFFSPRCCDPGEIHHAIDLMAAKMTPIYAVASGTVGSVNWSHDADGVDPSRCCTLTIEHDDGWASWYIHLNNDTPGTDDGRGWGVADGILPGVHVQAGQLIGWVGDSGNAEATSPHLHFELMDTYGVRVNPYEALRTARDQDGLPECLGVPATIFGDSDGDGIITGTTGDDVILGSPEDDVIFGLEGTDRLCGGDGDDLINGGSGRDVISGDAGNDILRGKGGGDRLIGGAGSDRLFGAKGKDTLVGGPDDDRLLGDDGDDSLSGDAGNDVLRGDVGSDTGDGGDDADICTVEIPANCES